MKTHKGRNVARNAAALAAAAASAVTSLVAAPVARAGQTGNQLTISLSGSTAMRNFTTSPGISLVQPETQLTFSNGTASGTVTFPSDPNYWPNGGLLYQLAPQIAGTTINDGIQNTSSALRLEWHEQGSVEGILDMINDQIGTVAGNAGTRDATSANPIWVNQNKFVSQTTLNGYTLGAFGTAQGQNKVQMAISDVNALQGFATGGSNAAAWNRAPTQAGYGRGNQLLAGGGPTNLANFGNAGGHVELVDGSIANMSGTLANGTVAATNGAWTTAGVGNLESKAVAVTATLFVANPGTGLDKLNRTDAQWLQTTGTLANGASFNMTTRDVNSGTRNVAANNTGVDPSWAVGVNDGGLGTSVENNIGTIKFSNKTAGGNLRTTVVNARMGVGTLGLSDALANTVNNSAQPLRALDYSNSADGSAGYVRASASTITDGSYAIWQNENYVTIKAPDAQYGNTNGANILGDTANNDVKTFRSNILNSSRVYTGSNLTQYFAPADALIANGFLPTQFLKVAKATDGIGTTVANPNYVGDAALQDLLNDSSRSSKFAVGGTGSDNSPTNVTSGTSSFYSDGSQTGTNRIAITAANNANGANAGGNYLFGNFNQKGTRDFAALQSAQAAQAALFASGKGINIASGSNFAVVTTGVSGLDAMKGQDGGAGITINGATKGDLIAMGDLNADGKFDGKDLYLFATGAALADSTNVATLTPTGGESLGDALRRGVLVKNAALDYLQTNATAQQKLDAAANLANDPTGANAFNKFDVNRDGRVSRNDAAIVDKFVGWNKTNLTQQLSATINTDGSVNPAGTQRMISLYQVGLVDGSNMITTTGDFSQIRATLGTHLQAGDVNFDGQIDKNDIRAMATSGVYNDGLSSHKWSEGDFNGDGVVDKNDVRAVATGNLYNAGNYDGGVASGPVTLTSAARSAAAAAPTPITYNYNPTTGDVTVSLNGNATVVEVDLISATNKFLTAGSKLQSGGLTFVTNSAHEQDGFSNFGSFIADGFDLGTILPAGLTLAQLQSDLTAQYSVSGNSNYVAANVAVPEPAALSLLGLSAVGFLARRRRRH